MEAESYLADGYAVRQAIQKQNSGWCAFSEVAHVSQPNRLKGINVPEACGIPYLSATQVFDLRPNSRRWLAREKVSNLSEMMVENGQILVTRSGTVGRATLAYDIHVGSVISDDLLRVTPASEEEWGWVYALLRSNLAQRALTSLHYGHVVKHLEVGHLESFPFVEVSERRKKHFQQCAQFILEQRNRAFRLQTEAEAIISGATGVTVWNSDIPVLSTQVRLSDLAIGRRRLEASFHSPQIKYIVGCFEDQGLNVEELGSIVERVWWMTRFSRSFGDEGMPYRSTDDIFAISPIKQKRVHIGPIDNWKAFTVEKGWILMACSGQIYGLNGNVALASEDDEDVFFSHDLIRIKPKQNSIRAGYLFAYLGHPIIGQPLVRRNSYGSSVPHLEPTDIETTPIARLSDKAENAVADLAEEAARLRSEANRQERRMGAEADDVIREFARINI